MSQQSPNSPIERSGGRPDNGSTGSAPDSKVEASKQVAHDVADSGRGAAREVVDDAKAQSKHLLEDAKQQARSQAEDQTHRASEFTRGLADELRSMADGEGGANGHLTDLARKGASRLEGVSERLDEGGLDGAIDEVRAFARRRPGLFLAGCLGAGVVIGRLVHNTDRDALTDAMSGSDDTDDARPDGSMRPAALGGPSPRAAVPIGGTGDRPTDLSTAGVSNGGQAPL